MNGFESVPILPLAFDLAFDFILEQWDMIL